MKMNNYPEIAAGHFMVIAAEASTGICLNVMGEYHQGREDEEFLFWVFDSYDRAEEFASYHLQKKPEYEFTIMDSSRKMIKVITK